VIWGECIFWRGKLLWVSSELALKMGWIKRRDGLALGANKHIGKARRWIFLVDWVNGKCAIIRFGE